MQRGPIEQALYEVDTISLLADSDSMRDKRHALDRAEVVIDWLGTFSGRQLRAYKAPIEEMLTTIKGITEDIGDAIEGPSN